MATQTVTLSGSWRVSSVNPLLDLITRSFSATITCSVFETKEVLVLPNISDFVVCNTAVSNPSLIMATATNTVRINFSGYTSMVSAASAGLQFKDFMAYYGSGAALPSAIHLANSGTDSSTVTILVGQ